MIDVNRMLRPKEVASRLGICDAQLRKWFCDHLGPPCYKIGRRRYYDPDEFDAWIASQKMPSRR
jgi:predicted DNA-binding transcriptional regulator AlpA